MNTPLSESGSIERQPAIPWKIVIAALAVLAALTVWWTTGRPQPDAPGAVSAATPERLSPEAQRAAGIAVTPAESATTRDRLQAAAVLRLDETRTARVGSIVDGVIAAIRVQPGERVVRGAVLGTMHSHLVHEAQADYKKAQADRRHHETELAYATEAEARAERLFANKAVSRQEVERARADRVGAAEALTIAGSELQRAVDELEHLGLDVADLETAGGTEQIPIRAPIAGVLLERLISPGTAVTPGTPLFVLSDLSQLWAVAEVDEIQLPHLVVGRPTELTVAAYPDERFTGRILAIGDTIHETTRRVSVRVAVPNPDRRLKPEMYASIDLGLGPEQPTIVVPSTAIQTIGRETVVFVESGEGQFDRRTVVVAGERDGRAELREGVRAGERVVTTGSFLLKSSAVSSSSQ